MKTISTYDLINDYSFSCSSFNLELIQEYKNSFSVFLIDVHTSNKYSLVSKTGSLKIYNSVQTLLNSLSHSFSISGSSINSLYSPNNFIPRINYFDLS